MLSQLLVSPHFARSPVLAITSASTNWWAARTLPTCHLSWNACQRRLKISRAKNIGSVFELSGVFFRLSPPYGGFLVIIETRNSLADQRTNKAMALMRPPKEQRKAGSLGGR